MALTFWPWKTLGTEFFPHLCTLITSPYSAMALLKALSQVAKSDDLYWFFRIDYISYRLSTPLMWTQGDYPHNSSGWSRILENTCHNSQEVFFHTSPFLLSTQRSPISCLRGPQLLYHYIISPLTEAGLSLQEELVGLWAQFLFLSWRVRSGSEQESSRYPLTSGNYWCSPWAVGSGTTSFS